MGNEGMIGALLAASVGTLALGLGSKWLDRKITARLQWRVGPPWYQPALDCAKLLIKETVVPESARDSVFLLAPLFGFAAACVAASLLWVMNLHPETGFVGDALVLLYLLAIPSLATILGALASGNPYASIGAGREMKLLISYELPLTIALLVAVVHTGGSLRIGEMVTGQHEGGVVVCSVSGALAFAVAVLCIQAKLGLIPFDQAEAESELMAGVYTEYSGPPLAVIFLTRFLLLAALPILLVTLFMGGVDLAGWAWVFSLSKFGAVLVLVVLIRNTNPRVRIDQSLRFFWLKATPIAVLALVLALAGRHYEVGWL